MADRWTIHAALAAVTALLGADAAGQSRPARGGGDPRWSGAESGFDDEAAYRPRGRDDERAGSRPRAFARDRGFDRERGDRPDAGTSLAPIRRFEPTHDPGDLGEEAALRARTGRFRAPRPFGLPGRDFDDRTRELDRETRAALRAPDARDRSARRTVSDVRADMLRDRAPSVWRVDRREDAFDDAMARRTVRSDEPGVRPPRSRDEASTAVEGRVDDLRRIRFAAADEPHVVVRVRTPEGRLAFVDLGPRGASERPDRAPGDRIRVRGERATIDGREVVVARALDVGR